MLAKAWLTWGLLALILVLGLLVLWEETNLIVIETHRSPAPQFDRAFKGVRIAHISDLHTRRMGFLEHRLLSYLDTLNPDLIFITGDFVNSNADFPACSVLVSRIATIAPTVATLGNNDHSFRGAIIDVDRLHGLIERAGVTLLVNEALTFSRGADTVYMVGLDDNFLWYDDYYLAARGVPPGYPRLLLAHTPDIATKIDPSGIDLILCGHTHGGQIVLPVVGALAHNAVCNAVYPFLSGFYEVGDRGAKMYVNRGIGTSYIQTRFWSRPEIAVFDF